MLPTTETTPEKGTVMPDHEYGPLWDFRAGMSISDKQAAIMDGAARANRHVRTHHEQGRMCVSCNRDDFECICAVPDTRVYWLPTCWRCEPVE